jgi:hypothetical protein
METNLKIFVKNINLYKIKENRGKTKFFKPCYNLEHQWSVLKDIYFK